MRNAIRVQNSPSIEGYYIEWTFNSGLTFRGRLEGPPGMVADDREEVVEIWVPNVPKSVDRG